MATSGGFNALLEALVEELLLHLKFVFESPSGEGHPDDQVAQRHHDPFLLVPLVGVRGLLEEILVVKRYNDQLDGAAGRWSGGSGLVRDPPFGTRSVHRGRGAEGQTYERNRALLGYTDDRIPNQTVDAMAAGDARGLFVSWTGWRRWP